MPEILIKCYTLYNKIVLFIIISMDFSSSLQYLGWLERRVFWEGFINDLYAGLQV